MKQKYIRIKRFCDAPCIFLIFPPLINHNEMVYSLEGITLDDIDSAGFCDIDDKGQWECFGESTSLGLKCLEEDTFRLNFQMLGY